MNDDPTATDRRIAELEGILHEAERELQTLTAAGRSPAGAVPGGRPRLLQEAQEKMRKSEEWLRLITDLVPHQIFAKDAGGRFLFANRATAEACGLSIGEVIGKTDLELGAAKTESEAFLADDLAVMRSGTRKFIPEETYTNLAGERISIQTVKVPFTVAETGEQAVLGVSIDITEQKRNEARFRRLVESNVQGVFFWNTKGEITGANDAFLKLTRHTREDLTAGRLNWSEMTPPEYAERDRQALVELNTTGVCATLEKEYIRKDGTRVPILIGAAMFEDDSQDGVCFVLDLTERKKLEAQFLRAQRMESIGTLAGGIAHDLNNVLAPIMMSVELLKLEHPDDHTQDILTTLERSCQRATSLVDQVLGFARGVEGQRIVVNPYHLMREWVGIMRNTFPKSITVEFNAGPDLWTVTGDPTQLHQVFLNLCVNARDALMPDGGNLKVSLENLVLDETYAAMNVGSHPGNYVLVQVTDNGSGIPPGIRDQIFDPFFTTKAIGKGTGLGLSTALAIVKSHGGFINLYSEVGQGTRFKVYLPAQTTAATAQTLAAEPIRLPRGHGEMILVVDDEESIRLVVQSTLERFGYRVLQARHGAEAVAIYVQHRDDIVAVLTDMAMPIMDGPALIIALKALNPQVKIIASSGLNSNGGVAKAVGAGVQYFVPKPYTAEALLKTLRDILGDVGK